MDSKHSRLFYNDVPPDLTFYGEVKFNGRLPDRAPPGAIVRIVLVNQDQRLNGLYFFVRGSSLIWYEYQANSSQLLKDWLFMENTRVSRKRAETMPDNRPWEKYQE